LTAPARESLPPLLAQALQNNRTFLDSFLALFNRRGRFTPSTETNQTMSPPKDFTAAELAMYHALRKCGDSHSAAVNTVMGERLHARLFRP